MVVDVACSTVVEVVEVDSPSPDDVVGLADRASVVVVVPADSSRSSPPHENSETAIKPASPSAIGLRTDVRRISPRMVPYLPLSRRLR